MIFSLKNFYFLLQVFSGPPESTRDVSVVAAKALLKGDWRRCADLITGTSIIIRLSCDDEVLKSTCV